MSKGGDLLHITEIILLFHLQLSKPGWPDLGAKWVRLIQMEQIRDIFQLIIQYILAR